MKRTTSHMSLMRLCQSPLNEQIPRKEEENMSVENWELCFFLLIGKDV
jgi:hypothetical protein